MNVVVVQGKLARDPEERTLRDGAQVVTYEVRTRDEEGRARSVPVAWRDPGAGVPVVGAGDDVTVVGEVARRFWRAGPATSSRTEVAATVVIPSRRRRAVRRAVTAAVAGLGPLIDPD